MFRKEHSRNSAGRYVFKIPFKKNSLERLGDSRGIILRRFYQLERRMQANDEFRGKYIENMREFIRRRYMNAISVHKLIRANYIPHYAISSKKFRTVFDASCKTSSGESLKPIQLVSTKLQFDLPDQIMRFRRYKCAVINVVVKLSSISMRVLNHESSISIVPPLIDILIKAEKNGC